MIPQHPAISTICDILKNIEVTSAGSIKWNKWQDVISFSDGNDVSPGVTQGMKVLFDAISEFGKILHDRRIKYAVVKGVVSDQLFYGGIGVRRATDIDVLIDRKDLDEAKQILEQLGYKQMLRIGPTLKSACREDILRAEVFSHETLPYVREHKLMAQGVEIDLNFLPSWATGGIARGRLEDLCRDMLTSRAMIDIDGLSIPILSPDYRLWHTVLHCFHEHAFFLLSNSDWLTANRALRVVKLNCLCDTICAGILDESIPKWIFRGEYEVEALKYAKNICSNLIHPGQLRAEIDMDYFYAENGRKCHWKASVVRRLGVDFDAKNELLNNYGMC